MSEHDPTNPFAPRWRPGEPIGESLRERVARAIAETEMTDPDLCAQYRPAADAAIAIVVAEAARVARERGRHTPKGCQRAFDPVRFRAGDDPSVCVCMAKDDIAAEILRLKEDKP